MIGDVHHLGLTVTDVDASAAWYERVLGFDRVGEYAAPDGARRKVFLRHTGLHARLGLTEHAHGSKDAFDETRVGLDHLAFGVSSRAELDAWTDRLAQHGVRCSPVAPSNTISGAAVLVFRDPDNIQLELFFDPSVNVR
jgi:glyoxylase I family protein